MRAFLCLWTCLISLIGVAIPSGNAMSTKNVWSSSDLILVIGASGKTGQFVIKYLEQQGIRFIALTSNEQRAKDRVGRQFNWVEADVKRPETLRPLMRDVTHIISTLGTNQFEGPNSPEFIDYGGIKNVVDVAIETGTIEHIVLMSSVGVTQPDHPLNRFGNVLYWKMKGEDYLRASGLNYTIVRAGGLKDTERDAVGLVLEQGDTRESGEVSTSRGGVAALLIDVLKMPDAYRKTFEAFDRAGEPPDRWRRTLRALELD